MTKKSKNFLICVLTIKKNYIIVVSIKIFLKFSQKGDKRLIPVYETAKRIIADQGRTQTWVLNKMNEFNPDLQLNNAKFSALLSGQRKMTGDELIAFCKVLDVSPDEFLGE